MPDPVLEERDFIIIEDPQYNIVTVTHSPAGIKGDKGDQGDTGPFGESLVIFGRDVLDALDHGDEAMRFPFAATIWGVSAYVRTAPTGSPIIFDLNINGTTIFADPDDRPRILAGQNDLDEVQLSVPVVPGDLLTVDIDSVGSTIAGANLSIFVRYQKV